MERDQAMKFMHDLLRLMAQKKGSDLFITAGFPPAIKIDGKITPVSNQVPTVRPLNSKRPRSATSQFRRPVSGVSGSMPWCSRGVLASSAVPST